MATRSAYNIVGRALSSYRACGYPPTQRIFKQSIPSQVRPSPASPVISSIRWHSAPATRSKVYDFAEVRHNTSSTNPRFVLTLKQIKSISESPSTDQVIIDVREPAEYEGGFIPNAINIPVSSQPDAMFLPEDEFEDRFGFSKPDPKQELVFYCKAGVRSSAAAQLAQQQGYEHVSEYRGSWLDWQKNGGKISHES